MELTTIPMEELAALLQTQLTHGGTANLVVTGNSMYPMLLHRRDSVTLATVPGQLRKGDLILYRRDNGTYVLHRIVTKPKSGAFFCAGDNQWIREPVCESQAIARVVEFTRKGKRYQVSELSHRIYIWVWNVMFPMRRPLIRLRRSIGRLRKKLSQ